MSRIISALLMTVAAATAFATEPLKLAENAPDRHVVVKGDTLWDISGKFLQEPWRWPEIWRLNKDQIKNPHLIYPGDIVMLDYKDGKPYLRLGKPFAGNAKIQPQVYTEQIGREIPSIPANVIEPFISKPLVVETDRLENAPRIIALPEERVIAGNGDEIHALGITEDAEKWYIYRPGKPLKDPKEEEVLGYEAFYLGTAQLKKSGEVSVLEILTAKEEVLKGDQLVPAEAPTLRAYVPRKADQDVSGRIMSVYGGVGTGGKDSVVVINQGSEAGVEPGHVLGMFSKRSTTYKNDDDRNETVDLPEDRYGLVFIFRTFDKVAYGLVMEATHPLVIGDVVKNP